MKILTILLAHFWAFIVIPAVIIKFFMTLIEDRDAFTYEEQEDIKDQLATLIHGVAAYHAIVQAQRDNRTLTSEPIEVPFIHVNEDLNIKDTP